MILPFTYFELIAAVDVYIADWKDLASFIPTIISVHCLWRCAPTKVIQGNDI